MRKNKTNKKKNKPINNLIKYSEKNRKNRVDTSDLTQNITLELISNQNDSEEKNRMRYLKEEIVIKNKTIDWFDFSNCFFDNRISFENCIFKGGLSFEKSIFNSDISFKKCIFKEKTDFRNISSNGRTEFLNCSFDSLKDHTIKEVCFSDSTFLQKVNFSGSTFYQEVNFSGSTFYQKTDFSRSIFNLKVDFSRTIFGSKQENNLDKSSSEVNFLIENAKFQKEVNFSKAIFYDAIYFSGTEFCTDIEDYAKESINFENAQFKRKVRFHHCKFQNTVRFENTSFNKLVDFYCAHFYKPQQFHFTDFLDRAIFSNTEFHEEVQFLHCKVDNSYVRFESATFKKGLDISRSNFNDKVNFWNIEIEESGEQYIFNNLESVKYVNDFKVQDKTPTIYKQFRETYRIIKDNFYRQNNKIEGSEFYIKEMSVYQRELLKKLECLKDLANTLSFIEDFFRKKVNIIFIIIYLFFALTIIYETKSVPFIFTLLLTPILLFCLFYIKDIILLLFNRISNYFGTDWVRGVVFTMMTGSLVSFFLLCRNYNLWHINIYDINAWIQSIGFLIRIINVVDMKPFEENGNSLVKLVDNNDTNNIILFIGRIFVAYGVYQTVQAFRKFGKS